MVTPVFTSAPKAAYNKKRPSNFIEDLHVAWMGIEPITSGL